jgi:hypothetical protein
VDARVFRKFLKPIEQILVLVLILTVREVKGVKGGKPLFLGAIARARGSSMKGLSSMIVYFILSVILVSLIIFPIAQVSAECARIQSLRKRPERGDKAIE